VDIYISIVHLELRSYQNLLLEFGVRSLTIDEISSKLKRSGLGQPRHISEAPLSLQTADNWRILWAALDAILNRVQKQKHAIEEDKLMSCAIFLEDNDYLLMSGEVYKGDEPTKKIFWWVKWITDTDESRHNLIPGRLVQSFTVHDALNELEKRNDLEALWQTGKLDLPELFRWFQNRHSDFLKYQHIDMNQRLRNLPIYPVAGALRPLSSNLYIPGDFEDPLGATILIDIKVLNDRKEFLQELGVQELDLITYVRHEVPNWFEPKISLSSWDQLRKLIELMASHLGMLRDQTGLREKLSSLPLIECTNGKCTRASQVYMTDEVRYLLGDDVLVAVMQESDALREFYKWLGVATEPRTTDILRRLQEITSSTDDYDCSVKFVREIFVILASRQTNEDTLNHLKTISWLPGKKQGESVRSHWFKPKEVYSSFQDYLFSESDALFLDLGGQTQYADFIRNLGVNQNPTVSLVIEHLQNCIIAKKTVNMRVYAFLNAEVRRQPTNSQWLNPLRNKRCILLGQIYVKSDFVFWGDHPFGEFKAKLGSDWREYYPLLTELGVKEQPDFQDYCDMFYEIELIFADQPIDESSKQIVYRCWRDINQLLSEQQLAQDDVFEALSGHRVIPNWDDILTTPVNILFEDRPDIAKKFDNTVVSNIILKGEGSWRAMQAAGVRLLSEAVHVYVVERKDPVEDQVFAQRIRERKSLFKRVLDAHSDDDTREWIDTFFNNFLVKRISELAVAYELDAFGRVKSPAEYVLASWQSDEGTLYFCDEDENVLIDIACELAFALYPSGNIISWIKDIIKAETLQEARVLLDRQRCPPAREEYEDEEFSTDDLDAVQLTLITDENLTEFQPQPSNENSPSFVPSQQKTDNQVSANKNQIPDGSDNVDRDLPNREGEAPHRRANSNDHKAQQTDSNLSQHPSKQESTNVDRESQKYSAKNPQSNMQDDDRGKSKTPASTDVDKSKKRRPSGKLRSYVTQESDPDIGKADSESATRRSEVDKAGIKRVLEFERKSGRRPQEMAHHNVGFDVKSSDSTGKTRYIEVKSLTGDWNASSPAALTKAQFETARERGNAYWLYVVERALSSTGRIHRIQNPVQRINQYLFDDGWQAVDDEEA